MNTDPNQNAGDADDFLAGFNAPDDDVGGAPPAQQQAPEAIAPPVESAPPGDAGAADAGAAAGAADAGADFASGFAEGGAEVAAAGDAGAAGAPDGGGAGEGAGGVDTAQNGEQGRVQSQELNLDALPENVRQLIEEQRQRQAQLETDLASARRDRDSLHGRVAPLQQQLARLSAAQQQPVQRAPAPAAPPANAAIADAQRGIEEAEAYFESDEFKRYAETWPDEARVQRETQMRTLRSLKALHEATAAQFERIAPQVESLRADREQQEQDRAQRQRQEALDDLTARHPDWQQLNESQEFVDWFAAEIPNLNYVDDDHKRARLNDASHVDYLLTRFKRDTGYGQSAAPVQDTIPPDKQSQQAADNQHQHQQQPTGGSAARLAMAGAPAAPGSPAPINRGVGLTPGDDFLAGFNS